MFQRSRSSDVNSASEVVEKLVQKLRGCKGEREVGDTLRQLHCHIMISKVPLGKSDSLLQEVYQVLIDDSIHPRLRFLSALVLKEISQGKLPIFFTDNHLKSFSYYDRNKVGYLLPLLLSLGDKSALEANLPQMLHWLTTKQADLRGSTMPGVTLIALKHPYLLSTVSHIKPIEGTLCFFLQNAGIVSVQKSSAATNTLFRKHGSSAPTMVTEIDGSPAQGFFTILNNAADYTEEQVFNVHAFSMLFSWLQSLYSSSDDGISNTPHRSITSTTTETVVSYCRRVIEQTELQQAAKEKSDKKAFDTFVQSSLLEAIRIMYLLCTHDSTLISRAFPIMKKVYQRVSGGTHNAVVVLALLQFFLTFSENVGYDTEPVFRSFFEGYVSKKFYNHVIAFETITFCLRNERRLLVQSNVFSRYFPGLFKIVAWSPMALAADFIPILPAMVAPSTYLEVFHYILDLPLVALMLERNMSRKEQKKAGKDTDSELVYRSLYEHILRRSASGSMENYWDNSVNRGLLNKMSNSARVTRRVRAVAQLVPSLLETYFDVMLRDSPPECLRTLLPVVFQRAGQLFFFDDSVAEVARVLTEKTLSLFYKYPTFVVSAKENLIELLKDSLEGDKSDMVLQLCWAIGEYASSVVNPTCTAEVLADFNEAVEKIAYECVGLSYAGQNGGRGNVPHFRFRAGEKSVSMAKPAGLDMFITRLLLVAMSTMLKLASRSPQLIPRTNLCLACILDRTDDQVVAMRARECMKFLQCPSVAASVHSKPFRLITEPHCFTDESSSIPFLVQPSKYWPGAKCHEFGLPDTLVDDEEFDLQDKAFDEVGEENDDGDVSDVDSIEEMLLAEAATLIQSLFRGHLGRARAIGRMQEVEAAAAATRIQAVIRGWLGRIQSQRRRRQAELEKEMEEAAAQSLTGDGDITQNSNSMVENSLSGTKSAFYVPTKGPDAREVGLDASVRDSNSHRPSSPSLANANTTTETGGLSRFQQLRLAAMGRRASKQG